MSRYLKHLPPLDSLITFEAVARNGSFTRAASELCVTQSAVSKQIRALEDNLKLALFERQARGIALTLAGASLFTEVSSVLERLQHSVNRIKVAHAPNAVTVLCTHAVAQFWLFPRLLAFNTAHPRSRLISAPATTWTNPPSGITTSRFYMAAATGRL